MTHLFGPHVMPAADKYNTTISRCPGACGKRPQFFLFAMPGSRDTDPILPTTNMAGGNNKDGKKKRVLVVGAGAAGMSVRCEIDRC